MIDPPPLTDGGTLIEDRYLDDTRLRLRRAAGPDGTVWKLARKYGPVGPGVEPIANLYLTEGEYVLLAGLPGATVRKRRHAIQHGATRFVVDRFDGALAGRMLAEAEARDPDALRAIVPPPWCGREVTGEVAFTGAMLARGGWPEPS